MDRKRPSWPGIIAASLACAGLLTLLIGLMHRYLFHEHFRWDESAGVAVGPFIVWLVVGALQRYGWWDRQSAGRRQRRG